jgi:hypothetical protein
VRERRRRFIFDLKGLNAIENGDKYQIKIKSQAVSALDKTSIIVWKSKGLQKTVDGSKI